MDKLPDRVDNKFRFVLLSARRAEQIMRGATYKVEHPGTKLARNAMREIEQDLVGWDFGPAPEPTPSDEASADGETN